MIRIPGYEIGQRIYEGKKTIINRGIRLNDGVPVFLKFPRAEYPDLNDIARLKKEYELNKRINSDNVVKVYSIENYEKIPILVLEDFGGESLQGILDRYKKFNLMDFLEVAIKLSGILLDIYNSKIIHKDINPNNIIINMENRMVKVTDFGIASLFSEEINAADKMNVLEGTLDYISPEQTNRMNHKIDYRTDFYSLGVIFYRMLTGVLPFSAEDELGIIHSHLAVRPVSPNENDNTIPEAISDIVMKLIEKMPENRYQNAMGLKWDLQKCMDELKTSGSIVNFKIGQKDISDRFQIPDKLYGREKELTALISSIERIGKEQKEAIMVAGYSGVGKSKLINKLRKSIKKQKGYFISGKFNQLQHDIPYSALVNSFKDLVNQILSESKEQIEGWKKKLSNVLGANGKVIISVIPEVEKIIGKQPEVIELPAEETKNRFNKVFQDFVRTFCELQHPLVIFLDDLQWADLASLNLIEVLMSDIKIKNILLIGAYRNNEVSGIHPLMHTLNNIQKENVRVNTIFLKPLEINYIKELMSETFRCGLEEANPLAELSQQKTEGNPFFLGQFLYSLYKEGLIWFNRERVKWQWDLQGIQNARITDNVVELIAARMLKFSKDVVEILKLAACIGNQFDLEILSIICKRSFEDTYEILYDVVKEGMILPAANKYSFIDKLENSTSGSYIFLHDRIQQAAYSLIEEEHKKGIHLEIGKHMLSDARWKENESKLFDIVNQLNMGIELVSDYLEKEQIAELELVAGRKAKKSNAYDTAYKYLRLGISLIEDYGWERNYELTHALYVEAAEAACLNGEFQAAERLIEIALNNSKTTLDMVKPYEIKIVAYTAQNKKLEVIDTALFVLKLLGVKFPKDPSLANVLISLIKTKLMLIGKQPDDLYELPQMTDPYLSAALRIMINMGMSTYMLAPNLFLLITLKAVRMYVKHGNLESSAIGYAAYGMLLCCIGDINSGYKFGKLSMKLVDKLNAKEYKAQTMVLFNLLINHWKISAKTTADEFTKSYFIGLETGNINYACTSACLYSIYSYYSGENLIELKRKMHEYSEVINKMNNKEALNTLSIFRQAVLNLTGMGENTCYLKGKVYDEDKMVPIHLEAKDRGTLCNVYLNKSILAYLYGEYDKAVENSLKASNYLDGVSGTLSVPVFYFYNSLILLATYQKSSFLKKKQILYKVSKNQQKMKKWAEHGKINYLHKFYLVEAEKTRVLKKILQAINLYDMAIKIASDNEYIQEEALANELASRFYTSIGNKKAANVYMEEALYCYTLWGAEEKVNQLKELHPKITMNYKFDESFIKNSTSTEDKGTESFVMLDTAAIVKATQAISEEIKLEEIFKKLIYILLENAGAQKIYFLTKKEGQYMILAEGSAEENRAAIIKERTAEANVLPEKIIYYVERLKESVILDNAVDSEKFRNDPYILTNQSKSIMCMPVLNKGETKGLLYLENNLLKGAFNSQRIEILKSIAAQLAISMENASLYKNLERSEEKYRKLVENIQDAVCIIQDGKVQFANEALARLTNYSMDEIIRSEFSKFVSEEDAKLARDYYTRRRTGEKLPDEYEIQILQKNKTSSRTVILNVSVTSYNERKASLVTLKDITERKIMEEEIRKHRDNLEELVEERTVELKSEISERRKIQKLLEDMATHDNLTGLANRKLFYQQLNHSLSLAKNNKTFLGIVFIDLDGFKGINDTFGHDSGDIVLKTVAERLLESVKGCDLVSRFGGDEFVVIMESAEDIASINNICEKIIYEVGRPISLEENKGYVTASIGVAAFPNDGQEVDHLIKKADNAMYVAKKSGKNRIAFSS